ncbi:MAG: bifunctional diaminohydroxyphosphoribosylaminopyrimidine deaminase/5-amino-6-(5-phosphoribosylamino)uracil reductase RibD [Sulfuricellaceae bacterium]|nr:bifunctional diaminohydroxyphosphoribosylaminopyrimidine deaminase/5-amino-6-(5-phosphoribosylamino)uracil reductase RibD [Sulfuricellaceae bacterium]
MFSALDHAFMARALRLAERGRNTTTPNPCVGCVIVKDGEIVGEGWHERSGEAHAEIHALRQAGAAATGATVYVSLEPCSHHGRTPPCAEALVDAKVGRVVAAMRDPNPQVSGNGLALLELAGIPAVCGLMEAEARELNLGFVARMTRGRPWLRIKTAASLDGKSALNNGVSQWITGADARRDVHRLRARSCAMLTGSGTVLADDPQLSARDVETARQPLRVVVDSQLQTPATAKIVQGGGTLIVCAAENPARAAALRAAGAEVLALPDEGGRVDLAALLTELARRGCNEVTVEAGARLNGALLQAGLVDEWVAYFAPLLLGDKARGLFDLPELSEMAGRRAVRIADLRQVGDDVRLIARLA